MWWFVERLDASGLLLERSAGALGDSCPEAVLEGFGRSVAACAVANLVGSVRLVQIDSDGVRVVVRRAECGGES